MGLEQDQIHLYALFASDGTCALWSYFHWGDDVALPVPPPISLVGGPLLYAVPLDEHEHIWRRIRAEAWALDPHGVAVGAEGHPNRVRHTQGRPHPHHAHIHLPGAFAFAGNMHPEVRKVHDRMATMSHLEMIHL